MSSIFMLAVPFLIWYFVVWQSTFNSSICMDFAVYYHSMVFPGGIANALPIKAVRNNTSTVIKTFSIVYLPPKVSQMPENAENYNISELSNSILQRLLRYLQLACHGLCP